MGRRYWAVMPAISVSVAQDLFTISAPADAAVRLHEVHITQDASETSEQLPFQIHKTAAVGSGGSSVTPVFNDGTPAFGGTVRRNDTTRATPGNIYLRQAENVLNGFHSVPVPMGIIQISPSGILVIGLEQAPGAALTMSGYIIFEEIGG